MSRDIGLCSVTFRALPPSEVIAVAAAAGLRLLEWGGDVHAPPGDPGALRRLRDRTSRAGLTIPSYGSYWRAGQDTVAAFSNLVDAALALGATRIRVWAGQTDSESATNRTRKRVAAGLRDAAEIAAAQGLEVATEFHPGTLTDTADSTLRLLDAVDHPAVSTYWQPPPGQPDERALDGLRAVLGRLSAIHVFSWWPDRQRLPLGARESLWRRVIELAPSADLLLEFVPGDDRGVLAREARSVRSWLDGTERATPPKAE